MENPENSEKKVLSPDHPLLSKFQQALREHLIFQINRAKDEIFEMESETKQKLEEKEKLGVRTYEVQQIVCAQQKTLENLVAEIETVSAAKEEIDTCLEESKKRFKEVQEKYLQTEKVNRELQTEIEGINYVTNQMIQWEKKIESHISVNKRIASKTRKDYNIMFQEKRQQDMLIYNLTIAVWKLESEIETLTQENKMKEKEVEELEQAVVVGNTNIEALQTEIRCLMHSWNSVVVAISNRDKGLECLTEEYRKLQEKFKSIIAEIEHVKKLVKTELNKNESFTLKKSRVLTYIRDCQDQIDDELFSKDILDKDIIELKCIMEQTEKDIKDCKMENEQKETTFSVVLKDFNKISSKKNELEEKVVRNLENLLANDKVAKNLAKVLSKAKEQRRDVEILFQEAENKSSFLSYQIENKKFNNAELKRLFEGIQQQQNELKNEADFLKTENEKYETIFKKRERQVDSLLNRYEKEMEKHATTNSPKEMVILELEKNIDVIQEAIKKLQSFWLREQKNMLSVSNERQEQIKNINTLKKQIKILEQKNMNINDELEMYKKKQDKVLHNINNLQNKSVILCEAIFQKRNRKDKLDRTNILIQTEYETRLRDVEFAVLQTESDITDIENDKVSLSKELIEVNREALEWEKKMQLARETVNQLKHERGKCGELGSMKLEIHKMELIYGQMKKAQEKLIKDLTHTISRRDHIFYISEARMRKQTITKKQTDDRIRMNYKRRLNDKRKKLSQMQSEIADILKKMKLIEEQKKQCTYNKHEIDIEINALKGYTSDLATDLEKSKTNRQLNFETLLIQQKKISMYNDLLLGRKPFTLYKKEDKLIDEYKKQKKLNGDLITAIETLTEKFPDYFHEFQRLLNSLKIGHVVRYTQMVLSTLDT